jgi:hypothetical protein
MEPRASKAEVATDKSFIGSVLKRGREKKEERDV